jgi:hypothetical protein
MWCVALCLTACASYDPDPSDMPIPPDLGLNRLMALPKPFESKDKSSPLLRASFGSDVMLLDITGLAATERALLAKQLSDAAGNYDVLLFTVPSDHPAMLLDGAAQRSSAGTSVKWNLRKPDGTLAQSFETSVAALALDSAAARQLGDQAAGALAQALGAIAEPGSDRQSQAVPDLPAPSVQSTSAAVATMAPPHLFIEKVSGAPGNGAVTLPLAMKALLKQDGVTVENDKGGADYSVSAEVKRAKNKDGDLISITWRITDRQGKPAGDLSQSNTVPAGSLDGDWGATAYDIAASVLDGLYDALGAIEQRKLNGQPSNGPAPPPPLP